MSRPTVTIDERVADFLDEEGNMLHVRCLVGEIPVPERGCIVTYAVEIPDEAPSWPERMELMKRLVEQGTLAELDRLHMVRP